MTDLSQIKKELRRKARILRDEFAAHGNPRWTVPAVRLGPLLDRGVALASYRPTGSEADPEPMEDFARKASKHIGYPRIDSDGAMRFYALGPSQSFTRGPYGFEAPAADASPLSPSIILVPLLAFDRSGTRLGQGGGHYDRALAAMAERNRADGGQPMPFRIGIGWSVQEMADLPREPWDVPLDAVITEQEWIDIA